jgi:imidazolonepropionase-like amidohydrolase
MSATGVNFLAGSDSSAPNIFPGFSLHDDLAYMVQAGLTPQQALQTATTKPAEFLQRSAQQGSIAAGRRADLVLLNSDPLADIHNTQKIEAVILNGILLDRAALDSLLANVQRYAAQ